MRRLVPSSNNEEPAAPVTARQALNLRVKGVALLVDRETLDVFVGLAEGLGDAGVGVDGAH